MAASILSVRASMSVRTNYEIDGDRDIKVTLLRCQREAQCSRRPSNPEYFQSMACSGAKEP